MRKRFETIISNESIIYDTIIDNLENCDSLSLMSNKEFSSVLPNIPKLDLLILDVNHSVDDSIPLHKIKTIINLTESIVSVRDIKLTKPIYLQEILNLIRSNRLDNSIFCLINDQWIFNERGAILLNNQIEIKLTEKENAIITELLQREKYSINKKELEQKLWSYYENAESSTVDVHLYKIKQKLPDGLFSFNGQICSLNITNIL